MRNLNSKNLVFFVNFLKKSLCVNLPILLGVSIMSKI